MRRWTPAAFAVGMTLTACSFTFTESEGPTATLAPAVASNVTPGISGSFAGSLAFANADPAFGISYPKGWTADTNAAAESGTSGVLVAFLAPREGTEDDFSENVNIAREQVPEGTTVADYTEISNAQAPSQIGNFHSVSEQTSTLSGLPAETVEYTGTYGSTPLHWLAEWTVSGSTAYVITYTAEPASYDGYLSDAKATHESFRLT